MKTLNTHKEVRVRTVEAANVAALIEHGTQPTLARLLASRGATPESMGSATERLPAKETLDNCMEAGELLASSLEEQIFICGDYDSDGSTSCSVMLRALRACGADVSFMVPNRIHGYGLSVPMVHEAHARGAKLIITVDNGVSCHAAIDEARKLNIRTLITDHHLEGASLPNADCIVNPNLKSSKFKTPLAGVGVAFYVLGALRDALKKRGRDNAFNLSSLLDLVALGTVADLVRLDAGNRTLVNLGIERIRSGQASNGIKALLSITGRNPAKTNAETCGFVLGPRINACGRLQTADIGIQMLSSDNIGESLLIAKQLDDVNKQRRLMQSEMTDLALDSIENLSPQGRKSFIVFDPSFHEGIVGLVASQVKEKHMLPCGALAIGEDGTLKGSFRSIEGVHIRDVLILVGDRAPGIYKKMGGHAMAAGCGGIELHDLDKFTRLFDECVTELADTEAFNPYVLTDGELQAEEITLSLAETINREIWGQGFQAPLFNGVFGVVNQRIVGSGHLKLELKLGNRTFNAMFFGQDTPVPNVINALYRLDVNEFNGNISLQLIVQELIQ